MGFYKGCSVLASAALVVLAPAHAAAQGAYPDFGDDGSKWANDGECDDKRFEGSGMTTTPLLDSDIGHDATDCRVAYEQGRLTFREDKTADFSEVDTSHIQWGDDDGSFAKDGECDDMRFEGPGMTSTRLLESDVKHDATDCRVAYQQGRLSLRR